MMEYSLKHVSGPATEPVSLAELKAHLLIADLTLTSAENADLESKIRAAREAAETYLGMAIGTQVWDLIADDWPAWGWRVPIPDLLSVDGVYYTDEDLVETQVATSVYAVSLSRRLLWLKTGQFWPSVSLMTFGGVRVRVTRGIQPKSDGASPATSRYSDAIRQAILVRAGTLYSLREDQTLGTTMQAGKVGTFEALLDGERLVVP